MKEKGIITMTMKLPKMQTNVGTMTFKETRGDWEWDGNVGFTVSLDDKPILIFLVDTNDAEMGLYSYSAVQIENPEAKPFFLGESSKKSLERLKTIVETVFKK